MMIAGVGPRRGILPAQASQSLKDYVNVREVFQMMPNFQHDLIRQFTQQGERKANCQNTRQHKHSQSEMLKHVMSSFTHSRSHSQQPGFHTQYQNALLAGFL